MSIHSRSLHTSENEKLLVAIMEIRGGVITALFSGVAESVGIRPARLPAALVKRAASRVVSIPDSARQAEENIEWKSMTSL